ncbi:MAG: nucleoside hydrolase [Bacteroidales bacterium]|nr:nucleoside hydrolase [Bacteroidales bacterium]
MKKTINILLSAGLAASVLTGCGNGGNTKTATSADSTKTAQTEAPKPQGVILDTDLGSSTDDVVLLTCLYHLMDQNVVDLKAIMVNREGAVNARFADMMNTYYKHTEVPVAMVQHGKKDPRVFIDYWKVSDPKTYTDEPTLATTMTDEQIAQLPDGYKLYRKILASADDNSMIIFSIGFASNLAHLLESQADEYSQLSGVDLVKQKVKAIYLQAGHFGKGMEPDYNFSQDAEHAKVFMKLCPAPMYFSPQEAGDMFDYKIPDMLSDLEQAGDTLSPLYHCYKHHNCDTGQRMWDVITMIQWLHPDLFDLNGPTELTMDDEMYFHEGEKTATSNRYWMFPKEGANDKIMELIRRYASN